MNQFITYDNALVQHSESKEVTESMMAYYLKLVTTDKTCQLSHIYVNSYFLV